MLDFVRGSHFQMGGRFLIDSLPADTTKWGSVNVRISNFKGTAVIADLTVEWIDKENGIVRVSAADTTGWPVGRARLDAQIVDGFGNTYNSVADYFRIADSAYVNPS
jgi:hypothetical protein